MTEKVTDPVLLKELERRGIDKDFVEFYQDYAMPTIINGKREKGKSPYAKFYRDLNSNKRWAVISGLPMVDADGNKIEVGWKVAGVNYFSEKNNLFRAKVQGTDIELIVKNDQPGGRKANGRLSYSPQLFLNGVEQIPAQSVLLPVDPVNPNYLENTLEWDYGICKRRLRIIEGSILGCWVFSTNPNGEVRIKYNQLRNYRLKLGQFKITEDEELIPRSVFDDPLIIYPLIVSDSATFYPDVDPETTSVDGNVGRQVNATETWAQIHDGNGTYAGDSAADSSLRIGRYSSLTYLSRLPFLFDTSGLPDDAVISSAVLSLYGQNKYQVGISIAANIYSSSPASNTALVAADYLHTKFGTTAFSTAIACADWSATGYNNFTLNASGITAISKTDVSKFALRESNFDAPNVSPSPWSNLDAYLVSYNAEQGAGYKPKLVIEYSLPGTVSSNFASKLLAAEYI